MTMMMMMVVMIIVIVIIIIIIIISIQRMWNLKCMIISITIGTTGIVTTDLNENLEALLRNQSIDSIQKTAILGTAHITRKVLQSETGSLSGGDRCWFR